MSHPALAAGIRRFNSQPLEGGCLQYARKNTPNIMFQLTAARRRLRRAGDGAAHHFLVSTHSRPKAAASPRGKPRRRSCRFNSQPLEGGCVFRARGAHVDVVSTHSRSKAAAVIRRKGRCPFRRFNSQPLEGGCQWRSACLAEQGRFNSQPLEGGCDAGAVTALNATAFQLTAARRRLPLLLGSMPPATAFQLTAARRRLRARPPKLWLRTEVSTHSRSKAAASAYKSACYTLIVSTHSRSKAAAGYGFGRSCPALVSTHSRSKAAANYYTRGALRGDVSTHSRSKAAAVTNTAWSKQGEFQLTAARRRLPAARQLGQPGGKVSTHSRSKAAAQGQFHP